MLKSLRRFLCLFVVILNDFALSIFTSKCNSVMSTLFLTNVIINNENVLNEAAVVKKQNKSKMEEKMEEMKRIHALQLELISCQTSTMFRKIIKKTNIAQVEKLRSVELGIAEIEVELPDPAKWPIRNDIEVPECEVDAMLKSYADCVTAMLFLK